MLIRKPPQSNDHAGTVDLVTSLFFRSIGDRAHLRVQGPIMLDKLSLLEPDLAVLRSEYSIRRGGEHPTADDVILMFEVALSSLAFDQGLKRAAYAAAGVPELWIIDVAHRQIECSRDPHGDGYRTTVIVRAGESIRLAALDLTLYAAAMLI